MKQIFEGHQPAINFAQTESKKQNIKLSVILTRGSGVNYVVCDSATATTVEGKLMGTYGEDIVVKPVQPPPQSPVIEVKKEPTPEPEPVIETIIAEAETADPEQLTAPEKPKKTRKPKIDE